MVLVVLVFSSASQEPKLPRHKITNAETLQLNKGRLPQAQVILVAPHRIPAAAGINHSLRLEHLP